MQGIELSRRFYVDLVRPWLQARFPDLPHAAALICYGSELLGFDDAMSRDHNWGPRVHLFLSAANFEQYAARLVSEFSIVAPRIFLDEPIHWRSRPNPPTSDAGGIGSLEHGLEVHTLEATLERMLGCQSSTDLAATDWLGFAEQRLLGFTAGAVFHDDEGKLTAARQQLAYLPDDVWLYKIACQWRRIAEEQAFVGRAGSVGDDIGSRIVTARLAHNVMRMGFLLERQYAPYAKWFGSAFSRLLSAAELLPLLETALGAQAWQERQSSLASAYLALARLQLARAAGQVFEPIIGPYHDRPFATINAETLIEATMAGIEDASVREMPVRGSLDQLTDLTALLEDPQGSHAVVHALLG